MVTGIGDYYSSITEKATNSPTTQRTLSDMYKDASGNTIETYSDGSKRTLDSKGNVLSDNAIKNSNISANQIQNSSKSEGQWDYMADVSKDKNRAVQMIGNIKQYAETNPQLFKNYDNFKKFFHYDERSASQKQVLDAAYKNYNKYGLNSNENKVADDASQVASDKGNARVAQEMANLKTQSDNLQKMYDEMNPKYQNLLNKYSTLYTKLFDDIAELKKLAKDYYDHSKAMYDEQSAGEAAGVESRLSAQGLGYTAIGSATRGVGNQWAKRYNDLMDSYLNNRMKLMTDGGNIANSVLSNMGNLTGEQYKVVSDYINGLNSLWQAVDDEQMKAIDGIYKPYEELTGKALEGTGEKLQTQSGKNEVLANYAEEPVQGKVKILVDNLGVDENVKLTGDYSKVLEQIANQYPNDLNKALSAAKAKFSKGGTSSKKEENTDIKSLLNTLFQQYPDATYEEVSQYLKQQGIDLSREEWTDIKYGDFNS